MHRLCELGCIERDLSGTLITDDGECRVRYLLNPVNGCFCIISDLEDDEPLFPSVIGSIERRLGLRSGFPSVDPPDYIN